MTVVPSVLDEQHRRILLISALVEHIKNLLANPKVSISMAESGISNVQDGPRLTILGPDTESGKTGAAAMTAIQVRPATFSGQMNLDGCLTNSTS